MFLMLVNACGGGMMAFLATRVEMPAAARMFAVGLAAMNLVVVVHSLIVLAREGE